ncbi:MAG: dimethyl sulfoxide reductase anchor subunit [Myxococcales bacterium]|jgi:Fe-S-cluster-containing dehydrogenase component/DMSO reductase anchor subunit
MGSTTVRLADLELAIERQQREEGGRHLPLISAYLEAQQDLSAVERFSQRHGDVERPLQERYYRDLLPATPPGEGQQYGFEVDLDVCSGCKACVTACHGLNGLDGGETWRSVGTLHGGTPEAPVQKTVTTACHHCAEPGCMAGCPVGAYEKDPETGIVRHLDDQCIGCQYCIFTCPYEVPQFNPKRGIVRKCDMCSGRLGEGEAPACVQACPNEAIAIRVVDLEQVRRDARDERFLPGAPDPSITLPTTRYRSGAGLTDDLIPADFFSVRPAHQHMPLVLMLVLTQLSVGAFCVDRLLPLALSSSVLEAIRPLHGSFALGWAVLALAASTAHLGRPLFAFRAVIGLRTSWLSREIVVFGAFAAVAAAHAGGTLVRAGVLPSPVTPPASLVARLGDTAALSGLLGVFCSVMLYAVTRRRLWSFPRTAARFFGTAAALGLATALVSLFGALSGGAALSGEVTSVASALAMALAGGVLLKLLFESSIVRHLWRGTHGELERSAILLTRELSRMGALRFGLALVGGIALPLGFLANLAPGDGPAALGVSAICLAMLATGEALERMTFFAALSSPRMPGGIA